MSMIITGKLNAFSGEGLIIWSVDKRGQGYEEDQYTIGEGDDITIYEETKNAILWKGKLSFTAGEKFKPKIPKEIAYEEWVEMFAQGLPCEVTPAPKTPSP